MVDPGLEMKSIFNEQMQCERGSGVWRPRVRLMPLECGSYRIDRKIGVSLGQLVADIVYQLMILSRINAV